MGEIVNAGGQVDDDLATPTRHQGTEDGSSGERAVLIQSPPLPPGFVWSNVIVTLDHWAKVAPSAPFISERRGVAWRTVSFGSMRDSSRQLAERLLSLGCGIDRPLAIIAPNSVAHAEIALAAMRIGAPIAPISPTYATRSTDPNRLRRMLELVGPAAIYVDDPQRCSAAIAACSDAGHTVISHHPGNATTLLADVDGASAGGVEGATAQIELDTIAKLLFTSGSTGKPKAVSTTHRMLAANQAAFGQVWPFLREAPPTLVDWLPWSHSFGGNVSFGIALWNGGHLYIDAGKPVPELADITIENLRELSPTLYFNVPMGYESLLPAFRSDLRFAKRFFESVRGMLVSGASMPHTLRDAYDAISREAIGRDAPFLNGWGATETGPSCSLTTFDQRERGNIGLPLPGVELKLAPYADKLEIRVRGANVMPGYWRNHEASAAAFDEDGFYRSGDAGALLDDQAPERGVIFQGRVAENFKLLSGSWVDVGAIRLAVTEACAPYISECVVAGHDRTEIALLVFLNPDACAAFDCAVSHALLRKKLRDFNTGRAPSSRVSRFAIQSESPNAARYEITDKGYVNQQAVLAARASEIDRLYSDDAAIV